MKSNFDLEISFEEFIYFHNDNKHTITYPMKIRDTDNNDIIRNLIHSLTIKINNKDANIKGGCFVHISTN